MYSTRSANLLVHPTLLLHRINLQSLAARRHWVSADHYNPFGKLDGLRAGVGNGYLLALLWSYKKTSYLRKMSSPQASSYPNRLPILPNQVTNTIAKMPHPTASRFATSFPTTQPSSIPSITLPANSRQQASRNSPSAIHG